jgi:transcriptional regulator with XRE-family HTH domain
VSNKLAEIRIQSNFKLRELAIRARVSASTLSDIERYGYVPRSITQHKIAQALGVDVTRIWPDRRDSSADVAGKTPDNPDQENSA